MSIFSRLRNSKKAAKEHKAKASKEIETQDLPKKPYKHVPTHAGIDALSGAPSSWKHEDKPKIIEHNKRRSMLVASRANSSLSTRTLDYPAGSTPSVPSLLRNSSYSSYNPSWNDRGDFSYLNEPYQKRKRASRNPSFIDSGIGPSPLGSIANSKHVSPSGSSKSSLTDENLEMRPSKRTTGSHHASSQPGDVLQSLNQNPKRKLGEASTKSSSTRSSPPVTPPVVAVPAPVAENPKKKRWTFKGKMRAAPIAVGVAS